MPPMPPAAPAESPGSEAEEETPPRRRTGLKLAALGVLAVVAIAVPTVDRYLVFQENWDRETVQTVAAGTPLNFANVSWKVTLEKTPSPDPKRPSPPDRTWVKVTATRVSLNADGARRVMKPDVDLRDPDGRKWMLESLKDDLPVEPEEHKTGTPYSYTWLGIVPVAAFDRIRVHLRPSDLRSDLPTEGLLKRTDEVPSYVVFAFTR
ncbi:hypothetical protein [Spongiactinospora sp. TRM90649]|uniref:hypothetical protein n=1 Tax=Spongiactinospora sp. TRM90649 TaxID=3031114 RepID=UPI0023F7E681|nr:hypothetical protein [Spongiactinospora sp. TRM90649]MDF5751780.1 hypothetical protein [Spongiactinospora sp. TRM90649]